jgi:hypothetical protein
LYDIAFPRLSVINRFPLAQSIIKDERVSANQANKPISIRLSKKFTNPEPWIDKEQALREAGRDVSLDDEPRNYYDIQRVYKHNQKGEKIFAKDGNWVKDQRDKRKPYKSYKSGEYSVAVEISDDQIKAFDKCSHKFEIPTSNNDDGVHSDSNGAAREDRLSHGQETNQSQRVVDGGSAVADASDDGRA